MLIDNDLKKWGSMEVRRNLSSSLAQILGEPSMEGSQRGTDESASGQLTVIEYDADLHSVQHALGCFSVP